MSYTDKFYIIIMSILAYIFIKKLQKYANTFKISHSLAVMNKKIQTTSVYMKAEYLFQNYLKFNCLPIILYTRITYR